MLWECFTSGPDWYHETAEAEQLCIGWRSRVKSQKRISYKPIIEILCDADEPCFFAFGRHTANDFCHTIGLFPGAPAQYICSSDGQFTIFLNGIQTYMQQWASRHFLKNVSSMCNSNNAFAYNYTSFHFYRPFLLVYRRSHVCIPKDLFNSIMSKGLFNPSHRIGKLSPIYFLFYAKISTQVTGTHFKQMINCVPGSGVKFKFTLTLA